MLDLEAEIETEVSTGNEETDRFYNELLNEVAKNSFVLGDLYKLSLMTDFNQGHNILEMDVRVHDLQGKKEFDILRPAIEALSEEAKTHFLAVIALGDTNIDRFFDRFFSRLGILKIKKINLIPNAQSRRIK